MRGEREADIHGAPIRQAWRWLLRPHPSLRDPALCRKSRLLAGMIVFMAVAFGCIDAVLLTVRPQYNPPWYGYFVLLSVYALNRGGRYTIAASLVVCMFPGVAFLHILDGGSANPTSTLSYLVLAPMMAMVLLSTRGVVLITVFDALGTAALPYVAPELGLTGPQLVGPTMASLISGVLAFTYIRHRNQLEHERETERLRLEDQLRQAQKMEAMGRLAGGIAHDFNNLLTVIVCNAELLAVRNRDDEELREILNAAGSAGELTQQLLAFTRQADLRAQVVDLNAAVAATVGMVERLIGEDVETQFVGGVELWPIRVDPAQIQQVLLNLATNARDAMPGGGRLIIRTENVPQYRPQDGSAPVDVVRLAVTDNGCGMDEPTRLRAFDPFFTTKEAGKGTGLGLAVVFGVAVQNGGFVEIDSWPGNGTTVSLYLPRSQQLGRSPARPILSAPPGSETILVVEDSPAVCRLCRRTLESGGYTVLVAASGEEARTVWQAHQNEIDLLLTDIVMPRLGGRELAAELTQERPGLPVLFMSGYAPKGADESPPPTSASFLAKPFTRAELLATVREILDRGPKSRAAG